MKKTVMLILFILLLLSGNIFSQNGKITGKVSDEDNFNLISANIYIPELDLGTASDNNGDYSFKNIPQGEYEVTFSYMGYQTIKKQAVVQSGRTTEIDAKLNSGVLLGDEIVVLGNQLKGQAKALNQQKENMNVTNVVSSDQIGRFPDANIGDALKRVPAITVNYDQGEARFGNIRGTEPRLNSFTINGERIPSAEAEIRSVQLDLVPSDMVQTIEVNKAVTPDMDADAIGGSVNLVTKGAPNDLRISGTLGGNYNQLSSKAAFNGAFTIGQRFLDTKLGVMINGSYQDHNLGSDNTEGVWTNNDGTIFPEEWDIREYQLRRLRKSLGGTIDYRFNADHKVILRGIYNHRNDWENRFRLRFKDIEQDGDGYITEIRRQTKGGIADNDNRRLEEQEMWTTSLKGEHLFGNLVEVDWSAAMSKASEERPNERYLEWRAKDVPVQLNLSDIEAPMFVHSLGYDSFELKEITEEYQFTEEEDLNLKLNVKIPLIQKGEFENKLKIGARLKNKSKNRKNNFFEYEPINEPGSMLDWGNSDYTNKDFLAGNYQIGRFTTQEYLGQLDLENSELFEKSDKPDEYAADNFEAEEKITAAYIQLNQHLGKRLSMIAGLRFESTNIDYKGYEFDENTEKVTPNEGDDNYSNVLPGLHFKYDMNDKTVLRFAWTNTIARPNYYDLVPYRKISEDNEELEIGNSSLKPTTSMNFDLMGERYFETVGLVSAGLFYKNLEDFIYVHAEKDYTDPVSGNLYEKFFQPRNGATADLFGFELAFQRRLDFLGSFFNNFNFYTNYTYTYSKADNPVLNEQVENQDKDIALPGTAPHIVNANLTYENEKLVVGLSFNYSAPYLDPDEMDLTPGLERYYDSVVRIDMNAAYAFTNYLRFFFEANNLTNQPLRYYAGDQKRTYQAEFYDVRLNAGLKVDF